MPTALVLAIACGLGVAALVLAEWRHSSPGRWIAKPLASTAFVGVALAVGAPESPYGRAVLAGLALSLVGDVLLVPRAELAFRAGLFSFLLAHVAYAAAFVGRGVALDAALAAAAGLAVVAVFVGRWLWPHVPARLRPPVVAYILAISAMVALAVGTVAARGRPAILAGALAFFLSDLAVARDRFVAQGFSNRLWGLPLYYGAQLVLAWTTGWW